MNLAERRKRLQELKEQEKNGTSTDAMSTTRVSDYRDARSKRLAEIKQAEQQEHLSAISLALTSRVDTWLKNNENYINNYNSRFKGFTGSYTDPYDTGISNWVSTVTKQKSNFDKEADSIKAMIEENKDYLNPDYVNEVLSAFDNASKVQRDILNNSAEYGKYWAQWESEDAYKRYQKISSISDMSSEQLKPYLTSDNPVAFTTDDGQEVTWDYLYKTKFYEELMSGEDFEKYSQIGASVKNPSYAAANGSDNFLGWKNPFAKGEEIGNIVTFSRDNIDAITKSLVGSEGKSDGPGDYRYQYMTDDEVAIYNYYLGKGDTEKAAEYLADLDETLNARWGEQIADRADSNAVSKLVFGLGAGLDQFVSGVQNIKNFITGDGAVATTPTQFASSIIREDLGTVGGVAYDLAQTTGNMLPSILVGGLAGSVAGTATMGVSAVGNGYNEMRKLGYNEWQARGYGLLVGASEAALQYALGGISKLGGKVTNHAIDKIVSNLDNAVARVAIELGGNMLSEGLEEAVQSVLEPAFKSLMTGEGYNVDWEEVFYSGLLGALSAGLLEGAPTIAGAVSNGISTNNLGKEYKNTYGANIGSALAGEAVEISPDSRFAQKMQAKADSGKELSSRQVGKLVQQNESAMRENDAQTIKNATVNRLTELGESGNVDVIATALAKQVTGEELTFAERKAVKNSKFGERVANELNPENIRGGGYSSAWAEKIGTDRINAEEYGRMVAEMENEGVSAPETEADTQQVTGKLPASKTDLETGTNVGDKRAQGPAVASEGLTEAVETEGVTYEAPEVKDEQTGDIEAPEGDHIREATKKVKEIASVKNGKIFVELENGREVDASEVDFGDDDTALVYRAAAEMSQGAGYNEDTVKVLVNGFESSGLNAAEYLHAFRDSFNYGATGTVSVSALEKGKYTSLLSEKQRELAFHLGKAFGEESAQRAQAERARIEKEKAASAEKTTKAVEASGEVIFDGSVNRGSLSKAQNAQIKVLRGVSSALGVKIHLFASEATVTEDGRRTRVFLSADGEAITANGWYDNETGKIWIDVNAGVDGNGLILFTATHELTHFIKDWSSEKYKVFSDFLVSQYAEKGVSVDELIEAQIEKAAKRGREMTREEAFDEVVADSCESFLTDSNAAEKISALNEKDATLAGKIKSYIHKLLVKIRNLLKGIAPDSEEGKIVRGMTDSLEQLYELWTDALEDAGEVYQSSGMEDSSAEATASRLSERFDETSVEQALWEAFDHNDDGDDNLIKVSSMSDYVAEKLGIEGDMYIYRDHAYENMVSREQAIAEGRPTKRGGKDIHFHNLGIEKMTRALLSINDPTMTIETKTKDGNPAVIMILSEFGNNGAPLYAVLSFYSNRKINGNYTTKPHIVLTVAERNYTESTGGRSGYDEIIKNAIKDGRVLDYNEKRRDDLSVIAKPTRLGDITKSSLDKSISQFRKNVKSFKEKNKISYSERDPDAISNREVLANALEGADQNDIEAERLAEYKSKIAKFDAEEQKLRKLRAEIKELSFTPGKRDNARLAELRAEAEKTANRINIYDKQLLRLEASKPLERILQREKQEIYKRAAAKSRKKIEDARLAGRMAQGRIDAEVIRKKNEKISDLRAERDRKLAEQKADAAEKISDLRAVGVREKIKKIKAEIERELQRPTDRTYIPTPLGRAMIEVCSLIDTDTPLIKNDGTVNRAQEKREKTKERLSELAAEYESLKNNDDYMLVKEHDAQIDAYLKQLRNEFDDVSIKDMSLDQLREFHDILRSIVGTLRDARKVIGKNDAKSLYEYGNAIISEQKKIGEKRGERSNFQKQRDKRLNLSLSPMRNIERMSGYNPDSALVEITRDFEEGVRKKNFWEMSARKSFDSLITGKNEKNYQDSIYKEFGKAYTDSKGRKFRVSKMQMMQAILSYEREIANAGKKHIEKGGLTFADLKLLEQGKIADAVSGENAHNVPNAAYLVADFISALANDKWAQDYMAAARDFFNKTAKDAINDTYLLLKHRIIARDKNYIPYEVDKTQVVRDITNMDSLQQTINSYGILQDTQKNAPQALIITGLNNMVDRHIDQVGSVYGLAIPVRNFNKIWNIRESAVDGGEGKPITVVQGVIEENWGADGKKFIEQMVTDLQGARQNTRSELERKIESGYIGATFALNLSVVMKQIGSLYTANSELDRSRTGVGMLTNLAYTMAHFDKLASEVDKYTAAVYNRRQGLSDNEVHTFITQAKKSGISRALNKLPAGINPTKWITFMDASVALSLWKYVKADVAKSTKLKGEELLKETAKRFDSLIENTQSMSDVLHKPEIQKRQDVFSKSFAMFKTDLYQSAGQLRVMVGRYQANKSDANKKALTRTVVSIARSAAWNSLMTTLFALLRYKVNPYRDDEEELTPESWLKRQGVMLAGDFAGYLFPIFGSEIVGLIENVIYGESEEAVDSLALTLVNDLVDSITTIGNAITEGEMPDAAEWENLLIKSAQFLGIPLSNIKRTVKAIRLHAEDIANGELFSFEAGANKTDAKQLYDAVISGNDKRIKKAEALFDDQKAIDSALRKGLRENDVRIKAAARMLNAGDIRGFADFIDTISGEGFFDGETVEAAIRAEASAFSSNIKEAAEAKRDGKTDDYIDIVKKLRESYRGVYTQDEIVEAVNSYTFEDAVEDDIEEIESIYKYSDIIAALESGDTATSSEIIKELIEVKTENNFLKAQREAEENGKRFKEREARTRAELDARSAIRSSLTRYWKQKYIAADENNDEAEKNRIRTLLHSTRIYAKKLKDLDDILDGWLEE